MRTGRLHNRSGQYAVLTALLLIVIIGMLAWAIDIGWIYMTKTQLHAAADSGALAGGTEFLPGLGFQPTRTAAQTDPIVRAMAADYASRNRAGDKSTVFVNQSRDILTGKAKFNTTSGRWEFEWGATPINAVRVVPKRNVQGGSGDEPLNLFFAPVLGTDTANVSVLATAVILPASGFSIPPGSSETSSLMPFAFEYSLWDKYRRARLHFVNVLGSNPSLITKDYLDNDGSMLYFVPSDIKNKPPIQLFNDAYRGNESTGVTKQPDGILEVSIFPIDQTSGNFGTIDYGASGNSTNDLKRQITDGINADDLSYFADNKLIASLASPLSINGDTGISAGIKASLEKIIGHCRSIALFTSVSGPGNNAQFEVVEFVGVRIMHVRLTGSDKVLVIQPCVLSDPTGIPDYDAEIGENTTIFTSLILAE